MLCMIRKKRGLVLPPPSASLQILAFLHSSPPPDPPEGGKGGEGCLHSYHITSSDSAPHAESTTFSRKFGVRAGDVGKKLHNILKGHSKENESN
jgi:hypothetical protein